MMTTRMMSAVAMAPADAPGVASRGSQRIHCVGLGTTAAVRIQAAFRGWRTRRRVVTDVQRALTTWMEELERSLEVDRVLLQMREPPQRARWRWDAQGKPLQILHLPRIDSVVCGRRFSFPEVGADPSDMELSMTSALSNDGDGDGDGDIDGQGEAKRDEEGGNDIEQDSRGSAPTSDSSQCVDVTARLAGHNDRSLVAVNAPTTAASLPLIDDGAERSNDNAFSHPASQLRSSVAMVATTTSLTVEHILSTHTRQEIACELDWTRRALRDRLQYLRRQRNQRTAVQSEH